MVRRLLTVGLLLLGGLGAIAQVPTITSFTPTSGPVGTTVTITGTNFDATPANNIVTFGATKGVVTTATTTQLTVTAPVGATYAPITVANGGGKIAYAQHPFVLTFPGGSPLASSSFSTGVDFTLANGPRSIASWDLDGDGKAEVIGTINNSDFISVFRNISTPGAINGGSLAPSVDFNTGSGSLPRGFDVDDLDGDGKPEIAVANSGSNTVSVFRNTSSPGSISSGSLQSKQDFGTGNTPFDVEIGDLDKDGKPDLVVANAGSLSISVYRNTSTTGSINSGSFASRVDFITGSNPFAVAVGDIDGDGLMDIVVANEGSNSISVFRNVSTPGSINAGSFSTRVDYVTADGPYIVAIADLDGDQKPDLAAACYSGQAISVLRNTSTAGTISAGSFSPKVDLGTSFGNYDLLVADLDGDGKPDLASATDNTNHISIFRNNATQGTLSIGSFAARLDINSGGYHTSLGAGDIDNDGKPDIACGDAKVTIVRNQVLAAEPTTQPGPIAFSHVTSVAFDASWTEPNPKPDGYLAIMSGTAAPNFVPTDGIPYNLNDVVGTVSGNNMYVVQNTNAPSINLISLTAGQTIHVRVYAFNGTGPTINYLTTSPLIGSQVPVLDTNKPTVQSNATPNTIPPNTDLVISANFADVGSGVKFTVVEYRAIAGPNPNGFIPVTMSPTTGSTFAYTLPSSEITELGIEYRLAVTDFEGNNNSASQTTYTTRIRHDEGLVIPYAQPGTTVAAYRIIAVPLILDDKSVNAVMGSKFGAYDPTQYRAYNWNGTRLDELNDETQLLIGRGYWFITGINIDPGLYTGAGVTPDVSPSNPFQITLTPGWTQIGNPYNFNISWSDILTANSTKVASIGGASGKIKVWRGQVEDVDELVTFEGGFVKNTSASNVIIDIPVAKNLSINSRKAIAGPLRNKLDQPSWEIMFNLKQGDATYNLGGLGMRPDAELGYDTFDDFNLPRFFEYLEVKFPKEQVGMTYTKDVVPSAVNFVWPLSIESNIGQGPITIGWDNTYFGSGKEIFLVDLVEHRAINMRETEKYTFAPSPSRAFKVVYGDAEFVKNEILPHEPVLFTPYPNPFLERVTIGYSLPNEVVTQGASLEIYGGQGARLSVVDLPAQPGEGSWEWVSEQAPGMYFVRLRIGDQFVMRKLIKR